MKLINKLFKKSNIKEVCTHGFGNHNLVRTDYCSDCVESICYVCSSTHMDNSHHVKSNVFLNMGNKFSEKQDWFNKGHIAKLDYQKIKCICGKLLIDHEHSAICAACGTATCSTACHDELNSCVFRDNVDDNISNKIVSLIEYEVNNL